MERAQQLSAYKETNTRTQHSCLWPHCTLQVAWGDWYAFFMKVVHNEYIIQIQRF